LAVFVFRLEFDFNVVRPKYSNEKKRQDIMDSRQIRALREYAARRGWTIVLQVKEVGFG
jgi:hypothetical protein